MKIKQKVGCKSKKITGVTLLASCLFFAHAPRSYGQQTNGSVIQMVFTSDAHYAVKRKKFRGDTAVDAHIVNAAMIKEINRVPALVLPADSGVAAGRSVMWTILSKAAILLIVWKNLTRAPPQAGLSLKPTISMALA
jgi:hypothetical protein